MASGQIPNARVPVLQDDGSLTLPWRLWAQNLTGASITNPAAPGVTSFDGRMGAVVLNEGDVIVALGFTPGQGTVTTLGVIEPGQMAQFVAPTVITGINFGSANATASVALSAGQMGSFTSGGIILADATNATKPATCWIQQNASAGGLVTLGLPGTVNTALTGLTPGAPYFLGLAGAVTAIIPTSGANQFVGYGTPAGNLLFQPGPDMAL